jgi:hypothetical protein
VTNRLRMHQIGRMGAMAAVAALAIAGPGAMSSAQAATPTLKLNGVSLNQAGLTAANWPASCTCQLDQAVYNGDTKMNSVLDGTERGYADWDAVGLNNLKRGATYHISVKYTDHATGAVVGQTNTVDVTTPASTDTTPPSAPTNIQFHKVADPAPGQVQLSWNPSTDNVDGSDVQYVVRENGQVTNAVPYAQKGDSFTVTAIDRSNNATTSQTVTWDGTFS